MIFKSIDTNQSIIIKHKSLGNAKSGKPFNAIRVDNFTGEVGRWVNLRNRKLGTPWVFYQCMLYSVQSGPPTKKLNCKLRMTQEVAILTVSVYFKDFYLSFTLCSCKSETTWLHSWTKCYKNNLQNNNWPYIHSQIFDKFLRQKMNSGLTPSQAMIIIWEKFTISLITLFLCFPFLGISTTPQKPISIRHEFCF